MQKKVFSSYKLKPYPLPNLLEVQINSYRWFLKQGLRDLFDEISPMEDFTNQDLQLSFLNYYFDEPKNPQERRHRNFSFTIYFSRYYAVFVGFELYPGASVRNYFSAKIICAP